MKKTMVALTLIVAIGAFLRLYNLSWDNEHYLHPDERLYIADLKMPTSVREFFSPSSPLNTHLFYYGPLPLYFYTLAAVMTKPFMSFLIASRLVSALVSILTIPVLFVTGKRLGGSKTGLITAFIFALTPASIQYAHFNTTESFLILFLSLLVYKSIQLILTRKLRIIPALAILVSCSYATKITGLTFAIIPATAVLFLLFTQKNKLRIVSASIFSGLLAIITGILLTPYNWIDFKTFFEQQSYMQGVILGTNKPPFVIIYEHTIPYLYQFFQVFPFTVGFITFPLSILGGSFLIYRSMQLLFHSKRPLHDIFSRIEGRKVQAGILLVLTVFPLLYFLWSGTWYSKFARYYGLLLPFSILYASLLIAYMNRKIAMVFLFLIGINGLVFFRVYLYPHTRVEASTWIYQNTPPTATIAFEHWDDPLPLPFPNEPDRHDQLKELQVYNPDSFEKIASIAEILSQTDYIALSSRRVYYSILRNKEKYPLTSVFYNQLFAGNLGFTLEKKFTHYPYFFSDDMADESFQSYDHPPVHIFKNVQRLPAQEIEARINLKVQK